MGKKASDRPPQTKPRKGFADEKFKHTQKVRVSFKDGDKFTDSIKGLNRGHALSRAAANWPTASRIVAIGKGILTKAVSGAIGPPDVRSGSSRTGTRKSTGGKVRGGQLDVKVPPKKKTFQRLKGSR